MENRQKRPWPWLALAAFLVLADQVVKHLVRSTMALGESRPLIPHLIELYHVENTGAAFSIFAGHTWILALLSGVVTVVLALSLWKGWFTTDWFSRLALTLILAGAGGNLIDRALLGAVTDMFNFTFITFGVFNVADICVVMGGLAVAVYLVWGLREESHECDDSQR